MMRLRSPLRYTIDKLIVAYELIEGLRRSLDRLRVQPTQRRLRRRESGEAAWNWTSFSSAAAVVALACCFAAPVVSAAPDDLDASWGASGVGVASGTFFLNRGVLTADGSLFALATRGGGGEIVKFDLLGRVDTRFAADGYLHPPTVSGLYVATTDFAMLPDGRYMTLQVNLDAFPDVRQSVGRYLPDGRPNESFGPRGIVQIDPNEPGVAGASLLMPGPGRLHFVRSKLRFEWFEPYARPESNWIARLTQAGNVDAEFGRFDETLPGSGVSHPQLQSLANPGGRKSPGRGRRQ